MSSTTAANFVVVADKAIALIKERIHLPAQDRVTSFARLLERWDLEFRNNAEGVVFPGYDEEVRTLVEMWTPHREEEWARELTWVVQQATPVGTSLADEIANLFANAPEPAASEESVPSKVVRRVPPPVTENPAAPSTPVANAPGPSVMVGGISLKRSPTPPGMLEAGSYTAIEDLPPHLIDEIFTLPIPPPLPPTRSHTRSSSQKSKGKQPAKAKGLAKKKVAEATSDEVDLAEAVRIANAKTDFTEAELKRLLKAPTNKMRDTDQPEGTLFTMKNGTGVMADGETRKVVAKHVASVTAASLETLVKCVGIQLDIALATNAVSMVPNVLWESIEVRKAKEFLKAQGRPSDVYVEVEGDGKKRKSKENAASKSKEASTSKPKTQASKPNTTPSSHSTSQPKVAKTLPTKTPSKSKPFVAVPSSKPSSSRRAFKSKSIISSDEEDSEIQVLSVKRPKAPSTSSSSASSSDEEPIAKKPRIATREPSPMQGVESQTQVTIPGSPVAAQVVSQPTPPDSSSDSESDSDKDDAGDKKDDTDSDDGKPSHQFIDDTAEEVNDEEESEETEEEEEDEDAVGIASEETRPVARARSPTAVSVINPHYSQEERILYGDTLRQKSTTLP
ncbi:hypothetical protein H0H93_008869, partial [Arthromyces matolae]